MENTLPEPFADENMLDDFTVILVQASRGQRFVNMLIDRVFFYVLWRWVFAIPLARLIVALNIDLENSVERFIFFYITAIVIDIFFYSLLETATGGRTIGKFVTRTRAVYEDGTRLDFRRALLRTICRIVPFDAFSALGDPSYPWHDRWSHTYVIQESLSTLPQ